MKEFASKLNWPGRCWTGLLLLTGLVFLAGATPARAQSEEGIKAAFIYNFAKFTEWPATAFADASAPITVGFVGADSLADLFEKNVVGKNANGRDFAVKRFSSATGTENCQIVFVGDAGQAAAIMGAIQGKTVLTLGDSDSFAAAGGMVKFVKDGAKISFDLDFNAINGAHLKLDPKLRQIARSAKGG
jgi:hypothetical protein